MIGEFNLYDFAIKYLPNDQEAEEFCIWALGKDYESIKYPKYFIDRWNKNHSKKLTLYLCGEIRKDLPKMISLWKEELKNL
jgi:hypothetical protein